MQKITKQDLIVKALKVVEEALEIRYKDSEDIVITQTNYHTIEVTHHTKHFGKVKDTIDLIQIR